MRSLLSIFYQAKHHQISEQPLDSKILGNLDMASEHFIVKWVVHQYESLPLEVENDIAHDLDEIVSSRRERFVEMKLKYPKAPPDGFLVFDGDGIEVRRWFQSARPKTVTVRYAATRRAEVPGAGSEPSAASVVTGEQTFVEQA